MAQSQRQADVHQDELCPPKKRYVLRDANKKIDLDNPLCPNESKIIANILQNYPLRFSIAVSSSVPWIYLGKFWPTLKEDGSKYRLTFTRGKMFARCLTIRATGHDQPPLQIMQMLYYFVNNLHVDYAKLLWKGLHYALEHPSTLIPYPIFTKLIVVHYMTAYPKISRRVHDKYHNLEHDEMVKNIFNSVMNKARVGMQIPSWMITDEMKLTENYRLYAEAFRVGVPTTQLQPIESIQGMHRTASAPSSPNPDVAERESSTQRKSNKSREVFEAQQNVEKVNKHFVAEEVEKIMEGTENVDEPVSSILNSQNDPGTSKEEKDSAKDDYELRRRVKGKHLEESRNTPSPTPIRSHRIHFTLISSNTEKLHELTVTDSKPLYSTPSSSSPKLKPSYSLQPKTGRFKGYKSFLEQLKGRYGYLFFW
uniref:Uncharacterized protein n=1 Tax=Tanacetum cinerariifolium TaxID=118510 RepID=A0A6L2K175_TANCI|nr:hypothetical protein [Tanacetum cinerariifolium]